MVATAFHVSPDDLTAPTRRKARVAFARQVAMYLCNVAMGLSLSQIAEAFRRDRTTVSHACHLVEDRRDEVAFDAWLDAMELVLKGAALEKSGRALNETPETRSETRSETGPEAAKPAVLILAGAA
ncbi:MAG: helix-turn-helix domain-containing protein [Pseudomonadota bacterium]